VILILGLEDVGLCDHELRGGVVVVIDVTLFHQAFVGEAVSGLFDFVGGVGVALSVDYSGLHDGDVDEAFSADGLGFELGGGRDGGSALAIGGFENGAFLVGGFHVVEEQGDEVHFHV